MNSKMNMRSLVESLNKNLYIGLSEFIVESDENWMNERRLLGGDDALEGFKGEEGYEKAKEYFSDYLNIDIVKDKEFVDTFKQLLDNLFLENGNPRTGAAPLVICYEKNSPHTFALRRWTYDMTHKFFEDYGKYFKKGSDQKIFGENRRTFKQYHNTTLSSVFTPSASDYEVIIATALNMAINNSSMNEKNYEEALGRAGCTNIARFINFYDGEKDFMQKIIDYANEHKSLIDGVDYYMKLPHKKEDLINNEYKDHTPKTDIIGYKSASKEAIRISVKKKSGAQLMSGSQQDTMGVLDDVFDKELHIDYKSIISTMNGDDRKDANIIKNALNNASAEQLDQDPNKDKKLEFGSRFVIFLDQLMQLNWNGTDQKRNEDANDFFSDLFKNSEQNEIVKEFIKAILMNSCTGLYKFKANSDSTPNTMLSFDLSDNKIFVSDVESYINAIVDWVWDDESKRADKLGSLFKFNHKSHDNQVGKDMRKMVLRINIPSTKEMNEIVNKYAS